MSHHTWLIVNVTRRKDNEQLNYNCTKYCFQLLVNAKTQGTTEYFDNAVKPSQMCWQYGDGLRNDSQVVYTHIMVTRGGWNQS